jgi:hypothetical protein
MASSSESTSINSSIYSPLPPPVYDETHAHKYRRSTIRLLTIFPGPQSTIIECRLQLAILEEAPAFEALSYVWGDPNPADWIHCNGQRKPVTPNLGAALRRLRYEKDDRLLWIDALCINQTDLDERSQQVLLMKDIYSLTRRVVVWLGEDNGQAKEALEIIGKAAACASLELEKPIEEIGIPHFVNLKQEFDSPEKLTHNLPSIDTENASSQPSPWEGVAWLYGLAWFRRIWVIQEVAFAPVVMYIGTIEVNWAHVGVAARWLAYKGYAIFRWPSIAAHYLRAAAAYEARQLSGSSIHALMRLYPNEATDPRDKVYGLLGLANDVEQSNPLLRPDYTKCVDQVYMDVVRHTIEADDIMFNLSWAFGNARYFYDEDNTDFLSWVPRWDLGDSMFPNIDDLDEPNPKGFWYAGGKKRTQILRTRDDSRILSLKGVRLGVASWTSNTLVSDTDPWVTIETLWNQLSSLVQTSERGEAFMKDYFVRTITIGGSFDGEDLKHYLALRKAGYNYARSRFKERTKEFVDSTKRLVFLLWADNYSPGYYCGVAATTRGAQANDVICVFFGHERPYLLRPHGGHYKFLGPCYLDRYMHGEAMKGLETGKRKEEWFDLC